MDDYWDSFDCEIQCEEVYSEDYEELSPCLLNDKENGI